ncbi:uncharacterized protein LOC127246509 isoform X2 [Andrographis paniculata]|uniref:uncharacterized protein LOC127246509 isoform X2 n=1 Tax=Andrographis paniculata TaxID=175694 RepID=UPI0021E8F44D|nr:uncharacterized protein LOC127246509 isoform X2 [Andrographis paniculata]
MAWHNHEPEKIASIVFRWRRRMRKLCPNLDKEDGLETVLEVPIPEEMFNKMGSNATLRWHNMRNLMRGHHNRLSIDKWSAADPNPLATASSPNHDQFMLLLKLVCSPLMPCLPKLGHASIPIPVRAPSMEASTANYIVQQYLAATGGSSALNAIKSMYAVGQMKLAIVSDVTHNPQPQAAMKASEAGGFVLWQKNPDLWYLELVVSTYKISAGSDGKTSWSHSSLNLNPTKLPPRPLRRLFQGLDPRSTANLFRNTVCIGETTINNENCFILKLETSLDILKAQSTANTKIVYHTIWGYFSQRTGLLIQFEDSKLIQIKNTPATDDQAVFYETSLVSVLEDYRYVDGINIAHKGKTTASLLRYGTKMRRSWTLEETWKIEEVDFNIDGLSVDYFNPPSVCKKDSEREDDAI